MSKERDPQNQVQAEPQKDYPSREKYWKECGLEEKIERMRDRIKGLEYQNREFREIIDRLSHHSHDPIGKMMVDFKHGASAGIEAFHRISDEDYF